MTPDLTRAERDVLAERAKQRTKWGDAHDANEHFYGELADAAAYLAQSEDPGGCLGDDEIDDEDSGAGWAVRLRHKHRNDRRRQLVIAAALTLAEIDRLDRETP